MAKIIFIAGGVMSGVGKGVATASIGRILQSKGFKVTAIKIDPYINIDAGTIRPTEHGEVFVTEDGTECDQDIGNYERFLNTNIYDTNYITTGRVYLKVIQQERNLEFDGEDVEVVPHIPLEVIRRIDKVVADNKADFVLVEIGGTVGEYQNILFLEAARMMKLANPNDILFILVSYLPIPNMIGEMKTKPTQYATRTLNSAGIQPDIIICRAEKPLDEPRKKRISLFCNVSEEDAISAPDVGFIYEIPLNFEKENLGDKILKKLHIAGGKQDMKEWREMVEKVKNLKEKVKIGIVGKYFNTGDFVLSDAYISVIEAVKHASWANNVCPEIKWLDAETYEKNPELLKELSDYQGIIIPGGFGERGIEGKIKAIEYVRKHKIPLLGLCYGMQMACVEYARNILGMEKANTTEIDRNTPHPVIDIMPEQKKNLEDCNYGATMRLGAYPARVKKDTLAYAIYGTEDISERHRHRWEVNPEYVAKLEKAGLVFSAASPDGRLMEIVELPVKEHPFFIGTQFHPEFKSRPLNPHPVFREFIKSSMKRSLKA